MTLGSIAVETIIPVARRLASRATSPTFVRRLAEPFFWLACRRGREGAVRLEQAKSVLVVRLDDIGDLVLTSPLLRELRHSVPQAWITLVVKPVCYNLVEHCPYVNEVLTFDPDTPRPPSQLTRHLRALGLCGNRLWRRKFDLAICPRWGIDRYHAISLMYLSGSPSRAAYAQRRFSEGASCGSGLDGLVTHQILGEDRKHEVEHNLDLVRFLGGKVGSDNLELWLDERDEDFARTFLSRAGIEHNDMLIALAPGAGCFWKCWPIERFVLLGARLLERYNCRLLAVGGPGEEEYGLKLEKNLGAAVVNAVGRATLRGTAALLRHSKLFVGNDSGPMHLAAAGGVPVLEFCCHAESGAWSANSAERFRPWGVDHIVLRPKTGRLPCMRECTAGCAHCILDITVEQAEAAARGLLS